MSTVGVVIPSHNRPDALARALQSLAEQTSAPDQIVVVDDGSEPPIDAEGLSGVTLVRNERASGASAARNRGWQSLDTDWVAFLDDDDQFEPEKIAAVKAVIEADPDLDVIYHPAWISMVNEGVGYRTAPLDLATVADPYQELLVSNCLGGTPMVTVRRSLLAAVGGFDDELPSMEDHDLWIRLAAAGAQFGFIDQTLTHCRYLTRGGGLSTDVEKHFAGAEGIQAKQAAGYAALSPAQRQRHELFVLNTATHRALMAGDLTLARALQWQVVKKSPTPTTIAAAIVTMLGPKVAFTLRSKVSRGPTAERSERGDR